MPGTVHEADPHYGTGCESYQLQIGLAGVAGLVAAQHALGSAGMHVIPARSLHVTVLPLIDALEELPESKAVLWARHRPAWQTAIARACAQAGPLRLRFRRLQAAARAVIVRDDDDPLAGLRTALAATCGLPGRPAD